mgnify:CR=1 FL=1
MQRDQQRDQQPDRIDAPAAAGASEQGDRHHASDEVKFHALQTRESGRHRFVSMHILVPGAWTVQQGHDLSEKVEAEIIAALPDTTVSTHVEPIEDPRSWADVPTGQHSWE